MNTETESYLNVSDDGTVVLVVDELDADLSTLSLGSSAADDLGDLKNKLMRETPIWFWELQIPP